MKVRRGRGRLPSNAWLKAAQNVKQLPWVHVTWRDASTWTGWQPVKDADSHMPADCQTIGFLIRYSKKMVSLCHSINEYGKMGDCLTIPREWVQRVKRVR